VFIKKLNYITTFALVAISSGILLNFSFILSNTAIAEDIVENNEIEAMIDNAEENQEKSQISEKAKKNELFLMQLRRHISQARTEYFQVHKTIQEAKGRLVEVNRTISSLNSQIKNLENLINNSETKIHNVERQIKERENTLSLLEQEIMIKKQELENQKQLLAEYLELLYVQENAFYDKDNIETKNISITKLLLQDSTTGKTFQEIEYFTVLEQTGESIFYKIENIKDSLSVNKKEITKTREKLSKLNDQLNKEKGNLKIQKNAKDILLEQTKGEEEIYLELIAHAKLEEINRINEFRTLSENLSILEQKIREEGDDFDPDKYADLINPNVRAIYEFELSGDYTESEKLIWPVNPARGLSAFFQDSGYKSTFGIPHNAIDIPISQGSLIHAPAAGVVYKVQDNGMGYSYIILAHKGGILTVYGHVSEMLVEEREVVLAGEVIGLSGGIPGTKGAGYLTTGAHLHFEVIKSGKHIDPLTLLPLNKLPIFNDEKEEAEETDE